MNYLLLTLSVAVNVAVNGVLRNDYSKKDIKNNGDLYLFNILTGVGSTLTLLAICAISGGLLMPSMYTVIWGIAYGIVTALGAVCGLVALETGPLSYTTVITSCSMVIPSLSGMMLYGESISVWQYIGIGLMIFSFVFAVDTKNKGAGTSVKWFIYCMLAFLSSGSVGVLQKIHQNSSHKGELGMFLVIAFAASAVFSTAMTMFFVKKKKLKITLTAPHKVKRFWCVGLVSGIGIALCNQINMYLSGVMDAIIFFPVVNGGYMMITAIVGLAAFKEKLSQKQIVGLLLGAGAILLLCNIIR